jgi:flagellar motor component MotA
MSSTNSRNARLLIMGRILVLALVAAAVILSAKSAHFFDPHGLLFVLAGGVALVMISFPGAEIRRALLHAAGVPGSDAEIRGSAYFWEAAGRGVWMLGVLYSILNLVSAMADPVGGLRSIANAMARSLLATFYGVLLAVVCFVPCWKLMGKPQSRTPAPDAERSGEPITGGRPGWRYGIAIGYVLFLSVLASTILTLSLPAAWGALRWIVYWPSLLVVLGGAVALVLFVGESDSGPTLSMAFAIMGLIGSLMGFIQALFGFADVDIGDVGAAVTFVLSSSFAALLGMLLVGAPLEDHAVRTGRMAAPSAFSRASWYVFPMLALIFLVLMFVMVVTPVTRPQ